METNQICTRQVAILIFFISLFMKLSSLPTLLATSVNTSAFILTIMFCILEILIFIVVYMFVEQDGPAIMDKSKIKYPFYICLFLYLILKLFIIIAFVSNFIIGFLFDTIYLYIIILSLLLPIFYLGYKGIKTIGRCADAYFIVTIACITVLLIFLDANFDFNRIMPIFTMPPNIIFLDGLKYGVWIGDAIPFLFCKIVRKKKFLLPISIGLSYSLIITIVLLSIALFGSALPFIDNLLFQLSVFNQLSTVLGRMQWVSIIPWIIGGVMNCSMIFWAIGETGKVIAKKPHIAQIFSAISIFIVFCVLNNYDLVMEHAVGILGYIMLAIALIVPIALLIILLSIRRKNAKTI